LGFSKPDLIRQGIFRAREASGSGFHLEAITIWESLIWDGLSSYIAFKTSKPVAQSTTLSALETRLKKIEEEYTLSADEKVLCGLRHQVNTWRKRRDLSVHGLVIQEEGKHQNFQDRVSLHVQYARNGEALFSEIKDILEKIGVTG
jgi:hypothetical protein